MTKFYCIYKDDKFIGYSEEKTVIKQFLSIRNKDKYVIKKIKSDEIPDDIISSASFESYALAYYQGYKLTYELPIFIYEITKFDSLIREHLITIVAITNSIQHNLEYIKTDKCDTFKDVLQNISDVVGEFISGIDHEPVYDEIFDVLAFFRIVYDKKLIH